MWGRISNWRRVLKGRTAQNDNGQTLSWLDVKELYDQSALDLERASALLRSARRARTEARRLEATYRTQLSHAEPLAHGAWTWRRP